MFRKKHCHLVTDPIEEVGIDGIKTTTENIKLDVIIYATGFSIEKRPVLKASVGMIFYYR